MREKYKWSRYNVIINDIDGNHIIYNIISNKYVILKKNLMLDITVLKKGAYNNIEIDSKLIDNGIVVPKDIDETVVATEHIQDEIDATYMNLFIVPTRFCNFDCVYCYEEHKPLYMSKDVQDNIITFIENNLYKYNGLIVTWFGGEPTVSKEIVRNLSTRIKNVCKMMKKPYYAAINTNGYELDVELMKEFLSFNIRYFQICLDGTKEIHNRHRKHIKDSNSFDKILNNLISIKNEINRGFKIVIRSNITSEILDVMDEYVDLLYKHFGDDDRFYLYWERAKDLGGERVKKISNNLLDDEKKFIQYTIKASKYGMKFDYNQFAAIGGMFCALYRKNTLLVDYDGTIQKCTCVFDDEAIHLGKLTNGSMIFDKPKYVHWMNAATRECKNCEIYPACGGVSCPACEHDSKKTRDCNQLKDIYYNIILLNYYSRREHEYICEI